MKYINTNKLKRLKYISYILLCIFAYNYTYAENTTNLLNTPEDTTKISINGLEVTPLFLQSIVNYKKYDMLDLYYYNDQNKTLYVPETMIKHWEITLPSKAIKPTIINNSPYYELSTLPGISYHINKKLLTLDINIPSRYYNKQAIELKRQRIVNPSDSEPVLASYLTYNVYSLRDTNSDYNSNGYFDLGILTSYYGSFNQSVLIQPNSLSSQNDHDEEVVWLTTLWRYDDTDSLRTYLVGGTNTSVDYWSGAAPYSGIKIFKNYDINPNIITFPQPNIIGNAALPANVELKVNNIPVTQQAVNTGQFEFSEVPVITGNGTIAVTTTNILGETTTTLIPYFTSPKLLKDGLNAYSFEAGFLRDNYGTKSFDYGPGLMVGSYSLGLSNYWTNNLHGELLKDQQSLGTTQIVSLFNGLAFTSTAVSHKKSDYYGAMGSVGYQYTDTIGFGGSFSLASENFTNVGLLNADDVAPIYVAQLYLLYNLTETSYFNINYFNSKYRNNETTTTFNGRINEQLNIGFSQTMLESLVLTVNTLLDLQNGNNWQVFASLNYYFDESKYAIGANGNFQEGSETYGLGFSGKTSNNWHSLNYNLNAQRQTSDNSNSLSGDINLDSMYGQYSLLSYYTDRSTATAKANLAFRGYGSVSLIKDHLYLSSPIRRSFALVKVPYMGNTDVYYSNQYYGKTNDEGYIFISDLSPFIDNKVSIKLNEVPIDTEIESQAINIVPERLNANYASFNIRKIKSAVIELINIENKALSLNSKVKITSFDNDNIYFVAYDGILYINDIPEKLSTLSGIVYLSDKTCNFTVNLNDNYGDSVYKGVLCTSTK
ncbi:fimbria/pilus outer membrane usher protein [Thiotrichales bacterium 19S3-7]|nr:fimbria/pilus outer membrane usher protein [Thiotrichales bacterium 19S3-7]MCF6802309.1 fimbria/pilus outer membrane usher protein [Thiotrichales bacterium 19S3-11]